MIGGGILGKAIGALGGKGERGKGGRVDPTGGRVAGHLDNSELGGEEMSDRDGLAATLSLISSQPSLLLLKLFLQVVFSNSSLSATMATTC